MNKLVVLTDLGTFKAYRLEESRAHSTPRMKTVDAFENPKADDRIGRMLSDDNGQLKTGDEINREIVEHLTPEARSKIEKNIHRNLVNAPKEPVLEHFK